MAKFKKFKTKADGQAYIDSINLERGFDGINETYSTVRKHPTNNLWMVKVKKEDWVSIPSKDLYDMSTMLDEGYFPQIS
jgi:hypothetical protein